MRLSTTVALSAMVAVLAATPGVAEAKARKHHAPRRHHAPAADEPGALTMAEQLTLAQQQIAQMQAQLNALQARLDGAATAPQLAQATTEAASAAALAGTAEAKAERAQATADKAAAALARTTAKTDRAAAAVKWAADTRVSGRVFFNTSNIVQRSVGNDTGASGTGINVKRIYIGIDHRFSDTFAMNLTTDVSNAVGQIANANFNGAATPALVGKGLYIKKAYLEAKLNPALWVRVGAAEMPWVPYIEGQYGYRHIESVLLDRVNYGTSTDWGVHVGGDLANKLISYQLSVVDGAGFRNVKVTKSVDFEGRVSINYNGLWGAVGGYVGKLGNNVQSLTATPATFRTAKRYDLAAGYKTAKLGVGAEFFYAKNWRNVTVNPATNALSQDSAQGISIFGNYALTSKWSLFGKYEWVQPNRITVPSVRDNYMNIGLQWEPVKIVDLALVFKRDTVKSGALATANGTIGCYAGATPSAFATAAAAAAAPCVGNGTYNELGIFGQLRF